MTVVATAGEARYTQTDAGGIDASGRLDELFVK